MGNFSKIILERDGYVIKFDVPLFTEDDNSIENYLAIDINNLPGELITTPLILNKFGVLLADADSEVREAKINYEVWEAKMIDKFRKKRASDGEKNPTKPEVDEHILLHPVREKKYGKYLNALKTRDYINSIYWSFKEKQENLKKLSLTLGDSLDGYDIEQALKKMKHVKYEGKLKN